MEVVPHRSAPTIRKPGSMRARRAGRPASTRLRYAVFLASRSHSGRTEGARLPRPDHARPPLDPFSPAALATTSPDPAASSSAEVTVPAGLVLSTVHLPSLDTPGSAAPARLVAE